MYAYWQEDIRPSNKRGIFTANIFRKENTMRNFDFQNATRIIFGKDAEKSVGADLKPSASHVLFVHYGDGMIEKLGLYDTVCRSLREAGIRYSEFSGIQPSPVLSKVREGIEYCRNNSVDYLLAVGGGSVMDTAKAIAAGVPYQGDVWDYFDGKGGPLTEALPTAAIVTYPATGSETNTGCVITNEDGMYKRWIDANVLRPQIAYLNPELTYSLPPYLTACGIADMFTHALERYMCNDWHVDLSDRIGEGCLRSILYTARDVMAAPGDYNARAEIMYAGLFANNGYISIGKQCGWESHAIGHELTAFYGVAHGATLSIIYPAWMRYVRKANPQRFLQFASRVFNVDYAYNRAEDAIEEGICRMENFFRSIGLPVRMGDIDIDGSQITAMAKKACSMGPLDGIMPLHEKDVEAIYRLAL